MTASLGEALAGAGVALRGWLREELPAALWGAPGIVRGPVLFVAWVAAWVVVGAAASLSAGVLMIAVVYAGMQFGDPVGWTLLVIGGWLWLSALLSFSDGRPRWFLALFKPRPRRLR